MKTTKRTLALILSLTLAFALFACGKTETEVSPSPDASPSPTAESSPEVSPSPTAELTAEPSAPSSEGYVERYTSDLLGITLVYPAEWSGIISFEEKEDGVFVYSIPRPEYTGIHGYIGVINATGTSEKEAVMNGAAWQNTPHQILHDADGVFVYIGYASDVQYDDATRDNYKTVNDGISAGALTIVVPQS
ncbi:MAG: hypothetical protein LBS90_05950 [Oscillospiraceae bacterium]|jgi:hypothetical protein|nr:hypothetical protein [Oscillospiraceae bacterium]